MCPEFCVFLKPFSMNCDWRMLSIITLFTVFCPMPISAETCFVVDIVVLSFTGISIKFDFLADSNHRRYTYFNTYPLSQPAEKHPWIWRPGAHTSSEITEENNCTHSSIFKAYQYCGPNSKHTDCLCFLIIAPLSLTWTVTMSSHNKHTWYNYMCVCVCILFRVLLVWMQVILQQWKTCCVACAA